MISSQGPTLWKTRTFMEKCLLVIVFMLLTMVVVLLTVFITQPPRRRASRVFNTSQLNLSTSPICVTENCVHAASSILNSIDKTVDPCTDFYAFSCNKWIKNNPIPDGKPMWGTFGKLEQQNHLVVKNVLERAEFKSEAEEKAKLYYESCLDEDETLEKLGGKPMLDLIRNIGGWNITTDSGFNLTKWSLPTSLQTVQNKLVL